MFRYYPNHNVFYSAAVALDVGPEVEKEGCNCLHVGMQSLRNALLLYVPSIITYKSIINMDTNHLAIILYIKLSCSPRHSGIV